MSQQAVGQDLMSLLKMFTSPRMGPFENTNTTTPFPPGSDQARQQADPSRYGGQQPPPGGGGGGLPPGFPSPVARRVVQPDGGAQAPTAPAADVPAPGAAPVAGTGAPAGNDLTTFMENDPAYQAYMAQVRRRQAEARQEQAIQNIFGGLSDFAQARSGGGGGGSQQKPVEIPSGDLTFGQFDEFRKRKEGLEAEAKELARIDRIVADPRMKGLTKDQLLTMRNTKPEVYAKFIADWVSGETETKFDPITGDMLSREKYGPADRPWTVVGNAAGREKAAADLAKTKAETVKVEQETSKSKTEQEKAQVETEVKRLELLDPVALKSPESLARIAKVTGIDAATLADLSPKEIQDQLTKIRVAQETSAAGARVQLGAKRIEDAQKNIETAKANLSERGIRRQVLERGDTLTGYPGAEILGNLAALVGQGKLSEDEARTRTYIALSAGEVLRGGKQMSGALSDKDREFLREASAGGRTLTRDEMLRVLALHDLIDRRNLNESIRARSKGRAAVGQEDLDLEDDQAPPLQPHELKVVGGNYVAEAIRGPGGRKYLETVYGKETANELVERAGEVAASKLAPEALQLYQSKTVEQLKAMKGDLEKANIARYGDNAAGALDIIIAQREAAERKP